MVVPNSCGGPVMRSLVITLSIVWSLSLFCSEDEIRLIPSTAEEIAGLNNEPSLLIGGYVHPLTGSVCFHSTDIVAKGAQDAKLTRVYMAPSPSLSLPQKDVERLHAEFAYFKSMYHDYRGWVFIPHQQLEYRSLDCVNIPDSNGAIYAFLSGKLSSTYGVSNISADNPSGMNDPRNIRFVKENDRIKVFLPNGTVRIYSYWFKSIYNLEKEILPNGKVVRYLYSAPGEIERIEACDPKEENVYAFIKLEGILQPRSLFFHSKTKKEKCEGLEHGEVKTELDWKGIPYFAISKATTHTGLVSHFGYESNAPGRYIKNRCGKFQYQFHFSPFLLTSSAPYYRNETIEYDSSLFLPMFYSGKEAIFKCGYKGVPLRVASFETPVGENGQFTPIHTIAYDPPRAGVKEGITTATHADGSQTQYQFSKKLLLEAVRFFSSNYQVKKEKRLVWDESTNWLRSIEYRDGNGQLFYKKSFEDYDSFGNPRKEIFTGDLTGTGKEESYTITRVYSQDGRNLLLREENEEGLIFEFDYLIGTSLIQSKVTKEKDNILFRELFDYDENNNLIQKVVDDNGVGERRVTTYVLRQESPFLHMPEWIEEASDDGLLRKTHLRYDPYGNVCQEDTYGSDGQFAYSIKRTYDEQGNVLTETNPLGHTAASTYSLRGLPEESENFSKRLKTKREYDAAGRLKEVKEAGEGLLHTIAYDYDSLSRVTKKTDPLNNATYYKDYDCIANQPTLIESPPIELSIPVVCKTQYDGLGRLIEEIDANQFAKTYKYNAYGSPSEILYPNGSIERFIYYKNGKLQSHTDREGLVTAYTYDALGRETTKKYSDGKNLIAQETFTYDSFHLKTHLDKEGHLTTYEYDGFGRKVEENRAGRIIRFRYDNLGRLSEEIYSNGLCLQSDFDPTGRLIEERKIDEAGKELYKVSYTFDADGNQKTVTRYPHNVAATTTYSHDPFSRLTEVIDPLGFKTTTIYDESQTNSHGQHILKKTIIDPNDISTVITYDPYGSETSREMGTLRTEKRTYDPARNLLQIQEGSRKTRFTYNCLNLTETQTRAFGTADERTTRYTYTSSGLLKTEEQPNGQILNYTYDAFSNPKTLVSSDLFHTFTYSANGFLLHASDGTHSIDRTLDPFGNILTETIDKQRTLTKTYDDLDCPLTITLPDQTSIHYSYHPLYLKTIERRSSQGTPLYTHTYESYDLNGNLLIETFPLNLGEKTYTYNPNCKLSAITSPSFLQQLTYDPAGRIIAATPDGTFSYNDLNELVSDPIHTYAYDDRYNRIAKDNAPLQHNDLDELTAAKYDLNGNLTQKGPFTLSYDPLNRLIKAESNDQLITFTYDPLNRRLSKTTIDTELYLYDGNHEIASLHPNGTLKDLRIHHTPIALELQNTLFIPISDHRGNIRQLIDPTTQTVAQSLNYTPFGEETTPIANPYNPWRYSSKRFDTEIGLSYFGHRYYDAVIGRWITTDPAGFIDGTNLYSYVLNNPLSFFDPDGRFAIPLFTWAIGGAIGFPVTLGVAAAVAVGYAACWSVQQMTNNGTLEAGSTAQLIATGIASGITGTALNSIESMNWCAPTSSSMQIVSTGYGGYAIRYPDIPMYKSKDAERRSSDEPGSPPYRGDKLGRRDNPPAEGFEWKGDGPPGSKQGNWVRGKGEARETLHPDFDHGPPQGKHWDYRGPGFPKGTRLYPDGSWENK